MASSVFPSISKAGEPLNPPYEIFDHFTSAGYITNATLEGKFSETADRGEWLVTVVDGGSDNGETIVIRDDQPGGICRFTTNDAASDGLNLQYNGESFQVQAGKRIRFQARIALVDVDAIRFFIGLCVTDTTVLEEDTGSSDYIGFGSYHASSGVHGAPDSDGSIAYMVAKDATGSKAPGAKTGGETTDDTGEDFGTDGTFRVLAFEVIGTDRVEFYIDGAHVKTVKTNLPDDEALTPTFSFDANGAAAESIDVDYWAWYGEM